MPATQGAVKWPTDGPSSTALVFDEELPLVDSSIDRILLVHALEHAENPRETLKEIWRVLAPCRPAWSSWCPTGAASGRASSTRPSAPAGRFRASQLNELLRDANFTPAAWSDALFFPPSKRRWMMRFHGILEQAGQRFWPIFSGVIVVEAQKRLYQGLPVAKRASRRVFVPVLNPQGAVLNRRSRKMMAATRVKWPSIARHILVFGTFGIAPILLLLTWIDKGGIGFVA